jgi:O-antigen ligase
MAKSKMITKPAGSSDSQALNWLIVGGSLVTVFFWAPLIDPFNAPKSWILSVTAFWLLGWIGFNYHRYSSDSALRIASFLSGVYSLTLLGAFIATDNTFVGFFGDYARRTGFLSYFSLTIFFLASAYLFRLKKIVFLDGATIVVGFLIGFYGFLQHYKIDFIAWNNAYNSVLSSLGNPDFAAAAMAIFMVLNFGLTLNNGRAIWIRAVAGINTLLLLVTIVFSQVRQGLLAGAFGIAIIVLVWIHQRQKIVAYVLASLSVVGGIGAVLGMLKMGPLIAYFYKESVTYRGDYWRAGWRMFTSHPFFGVGLDRYGAYFRFYRDATQVARRGPNIISNATHDVPLQLASTGGIFVLLAFLALTGFILWRGIIALRRATGVEQMVVATLFGAWAAYEAQSIISIDNLGIAIWGWILGGAVVGISVVDVPALSRAMKPRDVILQPLVSSVLALVLFLVAISFFSAESAMRTAQGYRAPSTGSTVATYQQYANKPLTYGIKDPHFVMLNAAMLAQSGSLTTSEKRLTDLITSDPHNYEAIQLLALIYEQARKFSQAIPYVKDLIALDPYNKTLVTRLKTDESSAQPVKK